MAAAAAFFIAAPRCPAASPFPTRDRLCQPLGPLAEEALQQVVARAEPREQELLAQHMKILLDDMQVVFGLEARERAGLELDAASMAGLALKQWKQCALQSLRLFVPRQGEDSDIAQWISEHQHPTDFASWQVVRGWTLPEQLPHWDRALEKRLGTARAAQWLQVRAEQRQALVPRIDGFLQRWAAECRKPLDKMHDERLQLLTADTALPPAVAQAAGTRLRQLMDDHVTAETDALREMLGSVLDENMDEILHLYWLADFFAMPSEQEVEAAWGRVLAAEAGAAARQQWDEMTARRTKERDERIASILEPSLHSERSNMERDMERRVASIVARLELDDERTRKLEALASRAINNGMEAARLEWSQHLAAMEKAGVELERNGHFYSLSAAKEAQRRHVWIHGLRNLLSPAELQQAEGDDEAFFRAPLIRALAKAAVVEMDRVVALDAGQRVELEQLLAPELEDAIGSPVWQLRPSDCLLKARSLPREVLAKILDEAQLASFPSVAEMPGPAPDPAPLPPRQALSKEERKQAALALSLHRKIMRQRTRLLESMMVRVADARRVLHLAPEQAARLATAAKGAVEAAMATVRERMRSLAALELANVADADVDAEASAAAARVPRIFAGAVPRQSVWQEALDEMLTPAQRAAWDKTVAEREAYQISALADLAAAEMARAFVLKNSQRDKIRSLLLPVLEANAEKLRLLEGQGSWEGWHLQFNTCLMPLAGVPKEQLRSVLTPQQWGLLNQEILPFAKEMWQQLQTMRLPEEPAGDEAALPEVLIPLLDP